MTTGNLDLFHHSLNVEIGSLAIILVFNESQGNIVSSSVDDDMNLAAVMSTQMFISLHCVLFYFLLNYGVHGHKSYTTTGDNFPIATQYR